MRGGLAAPMALAAGLILALLPATGPASMLRHPPTPQAKPGQIPPDQSAYTDAAYARAASA
ncbi:MAG: hypothetical protein ACRDP6_01540, partial [Actinoallomurus sp.]